jgi:anti-anti-sigma regulatory factor
MIIENFSQGTMFVDLAPEPQMCDELETISGAMRARSDCDIVVDFSNTDIVTASSLSKLLKLRQLLINSGRRLILCGLANSTRGVFARTFLDQIFEFAADKSDVLSGA